MKNETIILNSKTNGKVHEELIAGRNHIITKMVPIVGDSVMNRILYPQNEVLSSYNQLDMMKAPIGHPKVNGENVSINHPVADNIHNVGAFIRNPYVDGKSIVNELCIDVERANQTENGKTLVEKINNGDFIGVSTGLNLQVENTAGHNEADDKDFDQIGHNFQFDHVAILMNEAAAGEHVGTAVQNEDMIINELSADSLTMQLETLLNEELPDDQYTWVMDLFPDSKTFIYRVRDSGLFKRGYSLGANDSVTLLDDAIEVIRKITFVPKDGSPVTNQKDSEMNDKVNKKDVNDGDSLDDATNENGKKTDLTINELIDGAAAQGKTLVTNEDAEILNKYKQQKPVIDSIVANHEAEVERKRAIVAENLGLDEDQAKELTETIINVQYDKIAPAQNYSLNSGNTPLTNGDDLSKVDFVINHDEVKKDAE